MRADQLKIGQKYVFVTETKDRIHARLQSSILDEEGKYLLGFDSGDILRAGPDRHFGILDDLVPKDKFVFGKGGKTPFEVLVFHAEHEYEVTNSEKDIKKKIVAKFKDGDHAKEYALRLAMVPTYYRVILRA